MHAPRKGVATSLSMTLTGMSGLSCLDAETLSASR
jgi:hypothetical protein